MPAVRAIRINQVGLLRHAPQERQVVASGPWLGREKERWQPVMHGPNVVRPGQATALIIGDTYDRRVRETREYRPDFGQVKPAVQGGENGVRCLLKILKGQ